MMRGNLQIGTTQFELIHNRQLDKFCRSMDKHSHPQESFLSKFYLRSSNALVEIRFLGVYMGLPTENRKPKK